MLHTADVTSYSCVRLTLQCLQALARLDVPDFDSGVCIAWDQDVVFELHAAGEGLMSC